MENEDTGERRIRRLRPRAARGGFGGLSNSSVAEGTRIASEEAQSGDHEDPAIADLNEEVARRADTPAVRVQPRPEAQVDPAFLGSGNNEEEFNPRNRLASVRSRSSDYEKEYRLNLVSRMLRRQLPLDQIAQQCGVSLSQIRRDREEIRARLREEARKLDIDTLIGGGKELYEEVIASALRITSIGNAPLAMKLAAMRTALAGQNDMARFLQAAGVFDILRFRKAQGDGSMSDIERMVAMTEQLLAAAAEDNRAEGGSALGEFQGTSDETMDL